PQADAAIATVALARGDAERAALAAGAAVQAVMESESEDANLDVLLPAARAIFAGGPEEAKAMIRSWLKIQLSGVAQRTLDEEARVRWMRSPVGRELAELAGPIELVDAPADGNGQAALEEDDRRMLLLLTE